MEISANLIINLVNLSTADSILEGWGREFLWEVHVWNNGQLALFNFHWGGGRIWLLLGEGCWRKQLWGDVRCHRGWRR